jgi:hypothetical protein
MFVGHYAASLALKKFEKRASLGILFLGVQLVDIVFFPFVLLGIERINIIELLASLLWAVAAYAIFRWVFVKRQSVALVVGLAVFSHWVLDLVVHTPDLPLWSDASVKLGFGLWNNAIATYVLEAVLLLGALWLYLKSTSASTTGGKYGMGVFVVFLLLVNIVNIFGPLGGDSKVALAASALSAYLVFAAIAFWLDRKRS